MSYAWSAFFVRSVIQSSPSKRSGWDRGALEFNPEPRETLFHLVLRKKEMLYTGRAERPSARFLA